MNAALIGVSAQRLLHRPLLQLALDSKTGLSPAPELSLINREIEVHKKFQQLPIL